MAVRVRFAPSPTGYLHVGSARTALFNWLFARHHGGEFFLRIEDTDRERSKKEYEEEIIESLRWLGLDWDGPLVHQIERLEVYRAHADRLLKEGLAYPDEGAVRFKSPKALVAWDDLVRGRIEFDGNLLDDLVIMKSDGTPTYNFAVVCDDGEAGMTHVIRGEDHISNTPKQLPLYQALKFSVPRFAHIPLILGEDRSRLSKRHGATSIRDYRSEGFLPQAMVNFLALLGWSPGDNREVMSRDELIRSFTAERVLSTAAVFDRKKLLWMNGEYLRAMPEAELEGVFAGALLAAGLKPPAVQGWMKRFVGLYRPRVALLKDLAREAGFLFAESVTWDAEGEKVLRENPAHAEIFAAYAGILGQLADFAAEPVEKASRDFMAARALSGKKFIHPARIALTGRTSSPGFFETVSLLGRETCVRRLLEAADRLE